MSNNLLSKNEIRKIVEEEIKRNEGLFTTQEIIDSGLIPELKGFTVQPGKVSDSIYGGKGSKKTQNERIIKFENPTLLTKDDVPIRLMVRTPRISTHDIGRGVIPFKDQVLAVNHHFMREIVKDIIGNSQFDIGLEPNSIVIAAENLTQIPVENVLRAYMAKSSTLTSLYHAYIEDGKRIFCGHKLPEGLITNGRLPYIMDTPSTKDDKHDESISPEYLFEHNLCTKEEYTCIRNSSIQAFGAVSQFLKSKGLIFVDTKTEHGINKKGQIVSQDELYTMDSSRFWLLKDYNEQLKLLQEGKITELNPKSYSKEFARGFSKGEDGYTDEQRIKIAIRYITGIQKLTSQRFIFDTRSREERVVSGLQTAVKTLVKTK